MAQYKQVKRNGRWVTINTKTGKEVNVGEGRLGEVAKRVANELSYAGKNLVYSDKTDERGRPLTVAQAEASSKPKPKPKPKPKAKPSKPQLTDREFDAKYASTINSKDSEFPSKKAPPAPRLPAPTAGKSYGGTSSAPQQRTLTVKSPAPAKPQPKKPEAKSSDTRKPLTEMGSLSGASFGSGPSQNAKLSIGKMEYKGDTTSGPKEGAPDMERRRAFLDAKDSLSGIKAVKKLMEERKLKSQYSKGS